MSSSLATPDCPADNQAHQLAQFLYGTLAVSVKNFKILKFVKTKYIACDLIFKDILLHLNIYHSL